MTHGCSVISGESHLFQSVNGLQQLADTRRFKAWFLDQFGVLHDGKQPYPGSVVACALTFIRFSALWRIWQECGTKMVIISNSSRRSSATMEKMKSLGFDPSLFVGAITSGELTHRYLQRLEG